ncbi:MAG: hypothetical protein JJU28_18005 [Cyclobacteriaceae bacterium]|nr:hypothetical protein [Cyclobacteriaceae bacterium]
MKGNEELKQRMMDYLYGEMPPQEKASFEQSLRDNPEWQQELEELRQLRKSLSALEVVEMVAPVKLQTHEKTFSGVSNKSIRWFRPVIAVAASFILIFMMAYVADLRLQKMDNGWYLSFGPAPALMNAEQVRQLIRDETANTGNQLTSQMEEGQQAMLELLSKEYLLKKDVENMRAKNEAAMSEWLAQHAGEQQEFIRLVLQEYDQYLARQRLEDLILIEQSLVNLREEQDYQFTQTEEILTELLSSISLENKK